MANELPSTRQLRVAELIKRSTVEIFAKGSFVDSQIGEISITVSEVKISPDLRHATILFYPLGNKKVDHSILEQKLHSYAPRVRQLLNKEVKLKFSPEIRFKIDNLFDNVDKINSLLEQIHV